MTNAGLKAIGSGLATIALAGSGVGIGSVFVSTLGLSSEIGFPIAPSEQVLWFLVGLEIIFVYLLRFSRSQLSFPSVQGSRVYLANGLVFDLGSLWFLGVGIGMLGGALKEIYYLYCYRSEAAVRRKIIKVLQILVDESPRSRQLVEDSVSFLLDSAPSPEELGPALPTYQKVLLLGWFVFVGWAAWKASEFFT